MQQNEIVQSLGLAYSLYGNSLPLDVYFRLLFDVLNDDTVLVPGFSLPASGKQFTEFKARKGMCFGIEDDFVKRE